MEILVPMFVILGGGMLLGWLLLPLANWYRFTVPVEPAARPLGDLSSYEWLDAFIDGTTAKLESLGVSHVDDCAADDIVPGVRVVGRMLIDDRRRFGVFLVAIDIQRGKVWLEQSRAIIFSSTFADGRILGSRNELSLSAFPEPPSVSLLLYSPKVDLKQLRDNHLLVAEAMAISSPIVDPLENKNADGGVAAAVLSADFRRQFQHAFEQGYLQKGSEDSGATESNNPYQPMAVGPPQYTLSFTGAYRMTWCQLFPLRQLLLARARRRSRRLLKAATELIKQSV